MTHSQTSFHSIAVPAKGYILAVYLSCAIFLFSVALISNYTFLPFISPLLPFFPLLLSLLFGGWVAATIHTALFCIWCAPVFTGEDRVPKRSAIALLAMTFVTVIDFIKGWDMAVAYRGENIVTYMAWVNGGFIFILPLLWVWARRRGGITLYFVFHLLMFAWVCFAFFPYFGELP